MKLQYGTDVLVLPGKPLLAKLCEADKLDLCVLLTLASDASLLEESDSNAEAIAARLGCSRAALDASVKFWRGAGILIGGTEQPAQPKAEIKRPKEAKLPKDEVPMYTGETLQTLLDSGDGLRELLDECQKIAGKLFNPTEINKVVALSDYLRLEHEHILMLFTYCKSKGKPSVHYVERTAYNLYHEGVDTLAKFEEYVKAREEYESAEQRMRALCGFGSRTLTPKERAFFRSWTVDWKLPFDMLERAYEITIDGTEQHKLSLPYMNKVLSNWREAGYKSLAEVEAAVEAYRASRMEQNANGIAADSSGSFDTDEFIELALRRSYENALQKAN